MTTNDPEKFDDELAEITRQAIRYRNYAAECRKTAAGVKDRGYKFDELRLAQFYDGQAEELERRIRALTSGSPKI